MEITLYNYDGRADAVNKTLGDGVAARTMEGRSYQPMDYLRPTVNVRLNEPPTYNYAHVPLLKRYYFVNGVSAIGGGVYKLTLAVDVLQTYSTQVMDAHGTLQRSTDAPPYISTRTDVYDQRPKFTRVEFEGGTDKLSETGTIIMVTLKGKANGVQ